MAIRDAEMVAERLLGNQEGLETEILILNLPESTKVADLRDAITEYVKKKRRIGKEKKDRLDKTVKGITEAKRLKREIENHGIALHG
jgi:hypothetical protein